MKLAPFMLPHGRKPKLMNESSPTQRAFLDSLCFSGPRVDDLFMI